MIATPAEMEALGRQLWGEPNRQQSTRNELRFGRNGSKAIDLCKLVWHDHEAGTGGGYLDLYKLTHGASRPRPGFPIPPRMAEELGEPVAWWDYHVADGSTVARVVRFHPPGTDKTYRQCRPDGAKWRWKTSGVQIPVYRLPDILRAPAGSTVCIPEGEKCVDLIRSWGLAATTNAGGAKKFLDHHASVLAPYDCVVFPDNDEAGAEHANVVVAALRRAGCQRIRIATLPGLPPKGDVVDWMRAGGTPEAFAAIVATAPLADTIRVAAGEEKTEATPEDRGTANAAADAVITEFNAAFLVVNEAGKALIYAPNRDPILGRDFYDRLTFDDLKRLYLNRQIVVGHNEGKAITKSAAEVWLRSPDRRQYVRGVTFDPSGRPTPDGTLNLWTGFAIEPKPGSWARLRTHIHDVICQSDPDKYVYLMGWMARLIQHPAEQGEVAVVMRGVEGTGKGTLARALKHLLGQHGLAISNAKHLTGNFNSHLRDCVFLFADEAFFAGDRQHVGVLKSLITEPYLTIEAKYANAVQLSNFLHLMMASNEEWVIPASLEARRFFVLEVGDARKDDHAYFEAIWREMEAGGYAAMLHDLLHHNLTGFNVRRVPVTDGLQEQKKLSLGTTEAWWFDVLHRGFVFASRLGLEPKFGEWHEKVSTALLFASYTEFAERRHERRQLSREALGRFMRRMGATPARLQDMPVGEHMADVANMFAGTSRKAEPVIQPRPPGYQLGNLDRARRDFVTATGLDTEWEEAGTK